MQRHDFAKLVTLLITILMLSTPAAADSPWVFVVLPDFLNNDTFYPQPGWEDALSTILTAIAAENPDFVLVPGDLVQGRWSSEAEIEASAGTFYPAWKARLDAAGLQYYVVPGDHEIGDLPYADPARAAFFDLRKAKFVEYFGDTHYSFVHNGVLFAGLDEVQPPGEVGIDDDQLAWLDGVLSQDYQHKIVFAHAPVLGPVPWRNSSRLMFPGGRASALWQTLRRHEVDLYLAGEVHAPSYLFAGVHQVVSGSLIGYNPAANYLVVTVYPDRLDLEIKQIDLTYSGGYLYQAGGVNAPREMVAADGAFYSIGQAEIVAGGMITATGIFAGGACPAPCAEERSYMYYAPAVAAGN